MQFENGLNKWNSRVPPLDLSTVSVCPRETERRWHEIVVPKPKRVLCERRRAIDGLPTGEYLMLMEENLNFCDFFEISASFRRGKN